MTVQFQIAPEAWEDFLPLMRSNAQTSVQSEPGCLRFDVCTDPDWKGDIFLYELYVDEAAFQVHLDSDHFKAFDAATAEMILHKHVRTYREVAV